MAQKKIEFNDKTNAVSVVDRDKQVVADDLNEIKDAVNSNADEVDDINEKKLEKPDSSSQNNIPTFANDNGNKLQDSGKSFEDSLSGNADKIPNSQIVKGIKDTADNNSLRIDTNSSRIDTNSSRLDTNYQLILSNGERITVNEYEIQLLKDNQVTGIVQKTTYADLVATTPVENVSFKVTNDPNTSLNGYYHFEGTNIVKDAEIVNGVVEEGNVDAASGGEVFNSINKLSQSPFLVWFDASGDGTLTESYNETTEELTLSWDKQLLLLMGNNKFAIIAPGSVVFSGDLDFAYLDYNFITETNGGIIVSEWQSADLWQNPTKDTFRVVLFQRSFSTNKLSYSILSDHYLVDPVTLNTSNVNKMSPVLIDKNGEFILQGVYQSETWSSSAVWRSQKVEAVEGDVISYSLHSTTTANLVTFLDSGDNVISFILSDTIGTEEVQSGSILAPKNTANVVFGTFATYVSDSYYSVNFMAVNDKIIAIEDKIGGSGKEIIVDKNQVEDAENFIFNTISDALSVAVRYDTIKLFGEVSTPYEEQDLLFPEGLTVNGIGTPWIKGELPEDSTTTLIEDTSTIDAFQGCILHNIIVTAKNMRYPMHADFSSGNKTWSITNCKFIHYGNKEAYDYRVINDPGTEVDITRAMSAWGGGTKAGDRVYIDGCYFESPMRAFSTHNNVDFNLTFGASIVKVSNSELVSMGIDRDGSNLPFLVPLHIQNLDSNTEDLVILDNVIMNGYMCNQVSGTGITHKVITNSINQKQIWNLAGSSKSIAYTWGSLDTSWFPIVKDEMRKLKNLHTVDLTKGKAVKLSGLGVELFTSSDLITDFYGVLLEDTIVGEVGYVKHSGFIPWKYLDDPNFTITDGSDISVNASGDFVQNSTHVVMNAVDNNNCLIK